MERRKKDIEYKSKEKKNESIINEDDFRKRKGGMKNYSKCESRFQE